MRFVGVEMIDAEIDGYVENLVINGVPIMPLVEAGLDRLHPVRVLMRSDDPADLRAAWSDLVAGWDDTIARAGALPGEQRHEQVGGEWSVTQTIRHLVFVLDSWFSRGVAPDTAAVRCLRVVLDETWAHRRFAERDLAILQSPPSAANRAR